MSPEIPERFLIVGVNWIGDAVMSLPALQLFRQEHPQAEIVLLTKPKLEAFWEMCPSIDDFQCLGKKQQAATQLLPTIGKIREQKFDRAYILPNSFRSAFIPFVAGIPRRIGARGHWRRLMLTEVVRLGSGHQQFEAMSILGVQGEPPAPKIRIPHESFQTLERKLLHLSAFAEASADRPNLGPEVSRKCFSYSRKEAPIAGAAKKLTVFFQALEMCAVGDGRERPLGARPVITLLPGAAHGPSKRWPTTHFLLLARNLCSELNAVVLLGGGPEDVAVCEEIAAAGPDVINLAGQTTLSEWAAMLQASDCVVSNDSGGMHLASAVGTPVVGLYGLTDPEKTGPLGRHVVLQKRDAQGRDIKRDSDVAVRALALIGADEVLLAVKKLVAKRH